MYITVSSRLMLSNSTRTTDVQKEKQKKTKKNNFQRDSHLCYCHLVIYSNVVVSVNGASDEFALLRIDRYQLALLISKRV